MKELFEELYAMCKESGLIVRKGEKLLVIHAWDFQLSELCKYIRSKGVNLVENTFGGHYRSMTAMVDGYYLSLEFM